MLFNQAPQPIAGEAVPPGRGFIRVQGQPAVLPFQGVYCDESTILEAQQNLRLRLNSAKIDGHNAPRKAVSPGERAVEQMKTFSETPLKVSPPSAAPETVFSASESDFSASTATIDPDKMAHVAALIERGEKRKTKIIAEVWGVTSGPAYQAAGAEYEEIIKKLAVG
jgi:hypothetical protein